MISTALFYLLVVGVFLLMMSVLVTAHELGHYLTARMFGMGAEEFAVGFGNKPLITYMRRKYLIPLTDAEAREVALGPQKAANAGGAASFAQSLEGGNRSLTTGALIQTANGPALEEETAFTVRPLPLGGYVRIKGMVPEEDGSEVNIPGGFYSKPPWQRLIVLFAGPFFSVLAGVLVLIPYFMISGEAVPDQRPVIGAISEKKPAAIAGLKVKDVIITVDGQPVRSFFDVIRVIRDRPGQPTPFTVSRDGKSLNLVVTPEREKSPSPVLDLNLKPTSERRIQGKIGASPIVHHVPMSFIAATTAAVSIPVDALSGLVSAVVHPAQLKDSVGGPETMIVATADATSQSWTQVVFLAALLSISIGIFNLLPFPPLDGGQMAMAIAEMLRGGRRLSMRAQNAVVVTGMAIVAAMVLSVIVIDFQRYSHGPGIQSSNSEQGSTPAATNNSETEQSKASSDIKR
jgi:regulator of sigma E protease